MVSNKIFQISVMINILMLVQDLNNVGDIVKYRSSVLPSDLRVIRPLEI